MIRIGIFLAVVFSTCQFALAELLPENVIVVVNQDSADSKTIAAEYARLRSIPASNLIEVGDVPTSLKIDLVDFLSKILLPVFREAEARGIATKTQVIAYSAGFPTSVDVTRHYEQLKDPQYRKYQKPTASLTGLTYLYQFLLADEPYYLGLESNQYARGKFERNFANPFLGGADKEAFKDAADAFEQERYTAAADAFETLFRKYPEQSPLAIRAAECRARLGEEIAAVNLIRLAVASGWNSARYLREHPTLGPIANSDRLKGLVDRLSDSPISVQAPVEFDALLAWSPNGQGTRNVRQGVRYVMSCMLAVIRERGSTVDQALEVLKRSADADVSNPDAKFWFTDTKNIRSKTRYPAVRDSTEWLKYLGRDAEVIQTVMPTGSEPCVGLMLGTANMKFKGRRWRFVPGAISENLTSLSAAFGSSSQTKITELLHAGAALSGGAVAEPYALPRKFPTPMLYAYYASGLSGIEAFYLSIKSPYQYLIVGDPLVRAFERETGPDAGE